jgi:hypothetical protein
MNDIIDLNSFRKKKEETYFDEIVAEYEDEDHMFTDFAASAMAEIVDTMREIDINIEDNPECMKDVILCIEAIKGLMNRAKGKNYAMCVFADAVCGEDVDVDSLLESFLEY